MVSHFNIIYFVAGAMFIYLGYRQFYLRKNVDELEHDGKIKPDAAARIRKKPLVLLGWMGIVAGIGFFAKAFLRF
jgi:hypothetical protein